MKIEDRLAAVKSVEGLGTLLGRSTASVDWYGRHLVSVMGYEGMVELEAIAKKFLNLPHFMEVEAEIPLKDRLGLCLMWEKIESLYYASLKGTRFYGYVIPAVDSLYYQTRRYPKHIEIILGWTPWGKEEYVFQFKPLEYSKIWPNIAPKNVIYLLEDAPWSKRMIASKEMVKSVTVGNTLK